MEDRRRGYGLFLIAVGLGLISLGIAVPLNAHFQVQILRSIMMLLGLGTGLGFIWEGMSSRRRPLASINPAFHWTHTFSFLPLVCFGIFILYACYAWVQVGHWPHYAQPDPKELPLKALLMIVGIAYIVGLLSILLVPLGYLVWRCVTVFRRKPVSPHHRPRILFLAGVAVWVLDFSAELLQMPWNSTIGWLLD